MSIHIGIVGFLIVVSFCLGFFLAVRIQPWYKAFCQERKDYLALREKYWELLAEAEREGDTEWEPCNEEPAIYAPIEGDIEDHMYCPGCGADLTDAPSWSDHTVWCATCDVWRPWPKEMMPA